MTLTLHPIKHIYVTAEIYIHCYGLEETMQNYCVSLGSLRCMLQDVNVK